MTKAWLALWYESLAALGPLMSALAVGFAVIGADGVVYITDAGEAYLLERAPA